MRLIDADALKEALTNTQTRIKYKGVFTVDDVREFIDNAPTVKTYCYFCGQTEHGQIAERPKGKWIIRTEDNGVNYRFYCSCCNREVLLITDYCPYCGAKMKGDAE